MAKVRRESSFDLSDYFNRYGFGDGDDAIAKDAGYDYRYNACEILNGIMAAKGLKWTAEEEDVSSIHNNLYIVIKNENGVEVPIETVCECCGEPGDLGEYDEEPIEGFELFRTKVWPHAWKEFEKTVEEGEKGRG